MHQPVSTWCLRATLAWTPFLIPSQVDAQSYTISAIVSGLARPHGITVLPSGTLYFTELPTPGVGGGNGGMNTVSRLDPNATTKVTVVAGEPEPTHICADGAGALYWTCKSAGVVQRRSGAVQSTLIRNLEKPSGIAAAANGKLYLTEIPTPGVGGGSGGRNRVSAFETGVLTTLTTGEPEPTDVAVDSAGNLYWTCKSAGVILRRDPATQAVAPVLTQLEKPSGIAVDGAGNLYFTEVPTPGTSGANGGRNKVWRFDPRLRNLTLISFGDPEPNDVTVSEDGARVYWTCTSAGVIVRAIRSGAPVTVRASTVPRIGTLVPLLLSSGSTPDRMYLAATSLGLGPIRFGDRTIALAADELFALSAAGGAPCIFGGYVGMLDMTGSGVAAIGLPALTQLQGLTFNTAFLVIDPAAPLGVAAVSSTLRFTIQ